MDTQNYFLLIINWAVMVLGVSIVDAYLRPLFMGRHPRTQKRYTTFLYIILTTLVFLHSLRVQSSLTKKGFWSKETGRSFYQYASVVFAHTFAWSVVSFLFPGMVMAAVPFPLGCFLTLNKPLEFWGSKPCLGVSVGKQCEVTLNRRSTPEPSQASSPALSRRSSTATLVHPDDQRTSAATGTSHFQGQQPQIDPTVQFATPIQPTPPVHTVPSTQPMQQAEPWWPGRQAERRLKPYVFPGFGAASSATGVPAGAIVN